MKQKKKYNQITVLIIAIVLFTGSSEFLYPAFPDEPLILHPNIQVRTVSDGLITPTSMVFIDDDDILVLEKNTGRVMRVYNGQLHSTVLDLSVNFASERGLLGIALHPDFLTNGFVYLYWTESNSGSDSNIPGETSLFGNRVDRFVWDGSVLNFDLNLIQIRAVQADADQPQRGNNNGGKLKFGPDNKLYIFIGDVGRRGQLQNLPCGPTDDCPGTTVPDDQFGGPEPDDAHLTGVVLRLNDDGSTPEDNPFYSVGSATGGEIGGNIQKIFSYGHRNSFGMDFDPYSGILWLAENGDDSFSEINRVLPGMNGGWVQVMGPLQRIDQYKNIETSFAYFGLQQIRWSPENIAGSPDEALSQLFKLPGSYYGDPEFSWKYEVAPAGIGFLKGRSLGARFEGNLFVGTAGDPLSGGYLFRFKLTGNRRKIAVEDRRLHDRVADNLDKWDLTESESILFGKDFGILTDIQTAPNGNLYVLSLSNGAIYEVFHTSQGSGNKFALSSDGIQPLDYELLQNYPNPFNPSTTISWQSPVDSWQTLKIYDLLGREIATLVDEEKPAGTYEINFDASGLPSGIYFYKIQLGNFIETKKMILIR
ncbi:MAG: PQQ-dependent sugar dehydrogenase [Ignavibacteriaceae bacterium]